MDSYKNNNIDSNIKIIKIESKDISLQKNEFHECLKIRLKVFVEGQNVSKEIEIDGLDNVSNHYLIYYNEVPVGTTRTRMIIKTLKDIEENDNNNRNIKHQDLKVIKIERVSILNEYQNKGLGSVMMKYIINDVKKDNSNNIKENKVDYLILGSQKYIIDFYKKLGFVEYGQEFLDANMTHLNMKLQI